MPTPNEKYKQYGAAPFYYVNGLQLSNDAVAPNSVINVSAGTILDSSATYQLASIAVMKANILVNGLNGLDQGSVAASKVYAVYLISDPVSAQPSGIMFSLSYADPLKPILLPFGYSAYALLGWVATDASAHILAGYWSDNDTAHRTFTFDVNQPTAITAGASATLAPADLSPLVPNVNNLPVQILAAFTPAAASNVLVMQSGNSTAAGTQAISVGQVSAVEMTNTYTLLAQPVVIAGTLSPVINYKVTGGAVSIQVYGYAFDL